MSEETIKMLNMINDKIKKCIKDNNVDTVFIPIGGNAEFGWLTNKMLAEIIQLQQENQQLKEENKKLKQWDCNKDTRNSRQRVANAKQIKKINLYKSVIDEIREYVKESYDDVVSSFREDKPMTNFKARIEIFKILDKANTKDSK